MFKKKVKLYTLVLAMVFVFTSLCVTSYAVNNPAVGQAIHDSSLAAAQSAAGGRQIDVRQIWCDVATQTFNGTWLPYVQEADANGSVVHMSIQPSFSGCCQQINNGQWDSYFTTFAQQVGAYNKLIYIRPMQEVNLDINSWYWCDQPAADFINAFRRIVGFFRTYAPKAKIEWNLANSNAGSHTYSEFNPGTAYYDYAGMDGYNWGTSYYWAHWENFSSVFTNVYSYLNGLGKDVIISEYGCANSGGDKNAWIIDAFNQVRNSGNFNKVRIMNYFDVPYEPVWFDIDSGGRTGYNQAIQFSTPTPTPTPPPSSTRVSLGSNAGRIGQAWGQGTVNPTNIQVNVLNATNGMAGTHTNTFDRNWSSYSGNKIRVYINKLTNNQNNLYRVGLYDSAGHSQWYQINMSGVAFNTWTEVQTTTNINAPISGSGVALSDIDAIDVGGDWQSSTMNCCFQVDYADCH